MPKETFSNLGEDKQEKVMRAAIHEFLAKGFEKGNVGDIAKEAEVAKGSIYQYFENKKELFLYSVSWSIGLLMKKYSSFIATKEKQKSIFDFFSQSSNEMWYQLRDEREMAIFLQDVFMGKYGSVKDESLEYMLKSADDFIISLIREGQTNGTIRNDIHEGMISLFLSGATVKFKQYLISKARSAGEDLVDEDFTLYGKEIAALIELLKNGMGAK